MAMKLLTVRNDVATLYDNDKERKKLQKMVHRSAISKLQK